MASTIKAHAKINLHLEVLNRRDDGYHNIFSLMASVAFHDLLKLEKIDVYTSSEDKISVTILNKGGSHSSILDAIPTSENLVARAATVYLEHAGMAGSVVFSIRKDIPSGAGLGGGSSDAAAALKLLNQKLSVFTQTELLGIGSIIGADVPFCLQGGFAVCRGIGDIIHLLTGHLPYWVMIVNCGIHSDTGLAYRALQRSTEPSQDEPQIEKKTEQFESAVALGSIAGIIATMKNDFETPVFSQYPEIGVVKQQVINLGADYAVMTGSGSSIVGLFATKRKAREARLLLEQKYPGVIITRFL